MTTTKELIDLLKTLPEETEMFLIDSSVDKDLNVVVSVKELCLDRSIVLTSPNHLFLLSKKD